MPMRPQSLRESFEIDGAILLVGELDKDADPLTLTSVKDTLTSTEYNQLKQFKHYHAAWGYVAGRVILRQVVGKLFGIHPRNIILRLEHMGKPRVEYPPGLETSISHSGPYVAVMLARGCECGVDIEAMEELPECLPVHGRFFSRSERSWITEAGSESERGRRFLRLWTRKEAYLKATGEGLAGLNSAIEFESASGGRVRVRDHSRFRSTNSTFWISDIGDHPDYCLSVCFESKPQRVEVLPLKIGNLPLLFSNEL